MVETHEGSVLEKRYHHQHQMSNPSDIVQSSGTTSIVETNQVPTSHKQSPFNRHMYKNSVLVQSNSSGVL